MTKSTLADTAAAEAAAKAADAQRDTDAAAASAADAKAAADAATASASASEASAADAKAAASSAAASAADAAAAVLEARDAAVTDDTNPDGPPTLLQSLEAMEARANAQGHSLIDLLVKTAQDAYGIDIRPLPPVVDEIVI